VTSAPLLRFQCTEVSARLKVLLNDSAWEADVDGTPFGRYRLVELLGRGGMGEVWRAHDTAANNRTVAIKLLPPHLAGDTLYMARFRREADAVAQLNNPHIIPIHNYGEIDGRLYVDMRVVEGRDLQAALVDGPMQPSRAVHIIEQVANALQAAHEIGLVHRDVKPSNILLDDDDFAYLIDFGIARAADDTRLTETGGATGTLRYMAPERFQADPDEEDARVDIYALACILYECLTHQPPFGGPSQASVIAAHLHSPPPKPSNSQPDLPAQLDVVVAKGMAKDPADRYATTVALAHAAREALTDSMPQSAAVPSPPHPKASAGDERLSRRTRITLVVGGLAIVAVVAVVLGVMLPGRTPSPPVGSPPAVKPPPSQVLLPFTALNLPGGVVVDPAGTVYVADWGNNRVVKLLAGSLHQEDLPFVGLKNPTGVAVDSAGTVYVADFGNRRVVKLATDSSSQEALPFTGLDEPEIVAVDPEGTLYVTDRVKNQVVKLAAEASNQEVLPFKGLRDPYAVAVDPAGTVYVTDAGNKRVVKLAAGAGDQEVLPFTDLNNPGGGSGRPGRRRLYRRFWHRTGGEAASRLVAPGGAAVPRAQGPHRCGRGFRGQRLRHRRQPGADAAGSVVPQSSAQLQRDSNVFEHVKDRIEE
jgi:serine/threonine protein kinase, bacterial